MPEVRRCDVTPRLVNLDGRKTAGERIEPGGGTAGGVGCAGLPAGGNRGLPPFIRLRLAPHMGRDEEYEQGSKNFHRHEISPLPPTEGGDMNVSVSRDGLTEY